MGPRKVSFGGEVGNRTKFYTEETLKSSFDGLTLLQRDESEKHEKI